MSDPRKHFPPVFATNRPSVETVAEELNRLFRGMRERLKHPPTIAIATAYLNPPGFLMIADELEQAPHVRLLIGAEPKQPEERRMARRPISEGGDLLAVAIADHEAGLRDERDLAGFTIERDRSERRLLSWLESVGPDGSLRVEVRRYLSGFLHGKAYIVEDAALPAVLAGSSNLTFAGLMRNRELNLGYPSSEYTRLVQDWFEELWSVSEVYDLAALYKERFREHSPWVVFLRMLLELYGLPDDEDAVQTGLRLTGFQKDGVARVRRIMNELGGALVADEVGLGKTFLAGEILHEATMRDRQRAIVIVPAALKDSMWLPFLKTHDLISARIEVMSYDELRLADRDKMATLDEYALVVIDEAHNIRNTSAQRADAVRRLLGGAFPKRLLLLTATPVNNSLFDLHNLIRYFVRNDAAFASQGIPSMFRYIKEAQAEDPETLSPAHLFALLDRVALRRTRGFVKRYYQGAAIRLPDGREVPIEFPTPVVHRIDYVLSRASHELLEKVIQMLDVPDDQTKGRRRPARDRNLLILARYTPSRYRIAGEVQKTQVVNAGFLRSGLLKRLESSPHAFRETMDTMLKNHEEFLAALDQGKVLSGKAFTAWAERDSEDIEEVLGELDADDAENVGDTKDYRVDDLRADVEADAGQLTQLRKLADEAARGGDAKAARLVEELASIAESAARPSRDGSSTTDRRKVIVFSSFADTIEHLHQQVLDAVNSAPSDSPLAAYRGRVAPPVYGRKTGVDQTQRARILAGFAPATAGALREDGSPISQDAYDLLLTTDVLSEGVNLQQAGRIINYDLPWNPMRLVQRHGRIDRIGSKHEQVQLGCFFPHENLDRLLNLEETLQRKIAYAAVSIGVGEVIPGQRVSKIDRSFAETRDQIAGLLAENPELFETAGDSAALSGEEYRRRLKTALEDGALREEVMRLPAGSGTGFRSLRATEPGWVFCMRANESETLLRFVAATQDWGVSRGEDGAARVDDSPLRSLVDADPGDAAAPTELPDAAYNGVFDAWAAARSAAWRDWMRLTDPANLQPEVSRTLRSAADLVRDHGNVFESSEQERLAATLAQRWPLRISREVAEILDNKRLNDVGKVRALRDLVAAEGLQLPDPPKPLPPIKEDEIQLVAWMAVTPARSTPSS